MPEKTFPLFGGLDQESSVAAIPPGRVLSASNYEAVSRGYQRTEGYERYNGHLSPSDAVYTVFTYTHGNTGFLDALDQDSSIAVDGSATIACKYVERDAEGTDGDGEFGTIVLVAPTEGFFALADTPAAALRSVPGSILLAILNTPGTDNLDVVEHPDWLEAARDIARERITAPPGTGPVRGVLWYNERVHAWRDGTVTAIDFDAGSSEITVGMTVTGGTSGATGLVTRVIMDDATGEWGDGAAVGTLVLEDVTGTFVNNETLDGGASGSATSDGVVYDLAVGKAYTAELGTGWTEVSLVTTLRFDAGSVEITPGMFIEGDTSGAIGIVRSVTLSPDAGAWADSSAAGVLVIGDVEGLFQDDEVLIAGVTPSAVVDGAPTTTYFPPGGRYEFDVHNFYGSTGAERAYGANGVGPAFDFDGENIITISTGMPVDEPFLVQAHKKHLFLGFPGGSVQHSALGDPLVFSAVFGAAEIGVGHELTAIVPNAGGTLTIASEKSISALYGNDVSDWQLELLSVDDTGALSWTMQRIGQTIYLDERGVRSIAATSAFGGFKMGSYTSLIQKTLCDKRAAGVLPVASCVVKTKDQYLLFFDDGSGISIYFGRKQPEAMLFQYPFVVSCTPAVAEVDGVERIFVGTVDGYVYELNRGTSFDGEEIDAYIQLPFNHLGGPRVLKRFQKTALDLIANPGTVLNVSAQFDLGTGAIQPFGVDDVFGIDGGGGLWGSAGETVEVSPILATAEVYTPGLGANMSVVISSSSATQVSDVLQTATLVFIPRAPKR